MHPMSELKLREYETRREALGALGHARGHVLRGSRGAGLAIDRAALSRCHAVCMLNRLAPRACPNANCLFRMRCASSIPATVAHP